MAEELETPLKTVQIQENLESEPKHETLKKKKKIKNTKLKSNKNENVNTNSENNESVVVSLDGSPLNTETKAEKNVEKSKLKKKEARLVKKTPNPLQNTNNTDNTYNTNENNNIVDNNENNEKNVKNVKDGRKVVGREKVAKLKKKFEPKRTQSTYNKVLHLFKHDNNSTNTTTEEQQKVSEQQQNKQLTEENFTSPNSDKSVPQQKLEQGLQQQNVLKQQNKLQQQDVLKEENILKEQRLEKQRLQQQDVLVDSEDLDMVVTEGSNGGKVTTGTPMKQNAVKIRGVKKIKRASEKIPQILLNKSRNEQSGVVVSGYPVLTLTSSVILFVFLAQLVLNKISFNGRCVSKVLYPVVTGGKGYHTMFGYGACEYNLQQKAEEIGFIGAKAMDKGWPASLVSDENVVESGATFDSPNYRGFTLFGGMNANYIRNYKEYFRLFWSMFMHSGILHLIFNLIAQTQILWIIEPDWGFVRSLSTFLMGGFVGNLFAGVFEPSFTVVGSSGCMFGLIAALIPYCVENWTLLRSPIYTFAFALVITIISFTAFNNTVSIYSHLGGWVGGLLWGFATLRSTFRLKDCAIRESLLLSFFFKDKLNPQDKTKLKESFLLKQRKCVNEIRIERRKKKFGERMKKMFMYPIEYFKKGPFDILIRIIPLIILIVVVVVLCSNLMIESLYSKKFPLDETSKLSQCCYTTAKSETPFTRKVFWCFENYQTAINFCNKS